MYFFVFLPKLIGPSEKDLESKLVFGAALEPGMYTEFTQALPIFLYYPNSMHSKHTGDQLASKENSVR